MKIRADRLWLLGGLFGVLVIVAAAYLLAIKPIYADKADKEGQADDQDVALVQLRHQLSDLTAKSKNIATYTAQKNANAAAMPTTYDIPNFLRALQSSGTAVGVAVSGIAVSPPAKFGASAVIVAVPITLTATGTAANLSKFLNRLQSVQSRAVLVNSVNLGAGDSAGTMSANLSIDAFCRKSTTCVAAN
jgi:type IV pilus assembly protein PilO